VRAGSIPRSGPTSTPASARRSITLRVYTGADGRFTLYEDDGLTFDYERRYSRSRWLGRRAGRADDGAGRRA
jgi:hypothetical protein